MKAKPPLFIVKTVRASSERLGLRQGAFTVATTNAASRPCRHNRLCLLALALAAVLCAGCDQSPPPTVAGSDAKVPFAAKAAVTATAGAVAKLPAQYALAKTFESGLTSLHGIAIDREDRVYLCGEPGVRVVDANGKLLREWAMPKPARCIAVDDGGIVYVGEATRIRKFSPEGKALASWGDEGKAPGQLLAVRGIAASASQVFVADAGNRCIHRFDTNGKFIDDFGRRDMAAGYPGIICPSPYLDCAIDAHGRLYVPNPGMLRVEVFSLDGARLRHWGKPTALLSRPGGFFGCCNPTNIAVLSDGRVVTGEKIAGWVKVHAADGKLLALIGPAPFSPRPLGLDVAADSRNRIWVADPGDGKVKVFALQKKQQPVE